MRWVIGLAVVGSLATGHASACDYHEGFGLMGGRTYDGYEGYEIERQELVRERRDRAMEAAKQSFLARFEIQSDDPVQSNVTPDTAMKRSINVDRSPQPAAQDR